MRAPILILGIGNVLMGDEGIGVHVIRHLENLELPPEVECLDGGTGGLHLLGPLEGRRLIILIDATVDGRPPATVTRLRPRFSRDYPPALTAHDIGLKDLLDTFHLLETVPSVHLFAISIEPLGDLETRLTPALEAAVPSLAGEVLQAALKAASEAGTVPSRSSRLRP